MAASQLDLIMSLVQQLSASEQLQIIKRIADLLERTERSPSIEEQLAAMAADPDIQRELRQIEADGGWRTPETARAIAHTASLRDLSPERRWLEEHRDEYAGQWVALKGEQLISHGKDHLVVYRAAKAAGHPDAFLELVEASDALPFIF